MRATQALATMLEWVRLNKDPTPASEHTPAQLVSSVDERLAAGGGTISFCFWPSCPQTMSCLDSRRTTNTTVRHHQGHVKFYFCKSSHGFIRVHVFPFICSSIRPSLPTELLFHPPIRNTIDPLKHVRNLQRTHESQEAPPPWEINLRWNC